MRQLIVLLTAAIAFASAGICTADDSPMWDQAQHDVTAELMKPDATLAEIVKDVTASPVTNGKQALFHLNVLLRAGIDKQAVQAVRELKKNLPQMNESNISPIYYEACDHFHAWEVARAMVENYPDSFSGIEIDNRVIGHLLDSGWSADRIDAWLAAMPKGKDNYWIKLRLRFNKEQNRSTTLEKELADAVRKNPGDVTGAKAFLGAMAEIHSGDQTPPDLAWFAEIVKPELATESEELASDFARLRLPKQAVAYYRQAIVKDLTPAETHNLGRMSQTMIAEPVMQARFAAGVREEMAKCLLELHEADEAQKVMLEAADIRAKNRIGPNNVLAGQVQADSGARVVEEKIKAEEKTSENDPKYWQERAQYYHGRGEADQEEAALKKGLALTKPQVQERVFKGPGDWRSAFLSDYARFLLQHNRAEEGAAMLRKELADSPADAESTKQAANRLAFDFVKYIKPDDSALWKWLENRPQWEYAEERLLWEMLKASPADKLDGNFQRAEKLAADTDPTRALTLGWIENRMQAAKRSLPLLEYAARNAKDDDMKQKAFFDLMESYLDAGEWEHAEQVFPTAALRLTEREVPEWCGRLAVTAAKAGAKPEAMRIWSRMANIDLTVTAPLTEMARAGLKDELIEFYKKVQTDIPASEVPPRAFAILREIILVTAVPLPAGSKLHLEFGPDEIYDNDEAVKLVDEARTHDSQFAKQDDPDRAKAIELYEKAINAQPNAKINAKLADRIAQMYAFSMDASRNERPNYEMAAQWWTRCLKLSNPQQLLWSQAQMGLAGTASGNLQSMIDRYDEILKVDADKLELEDWKIWPVVDSVQAQAAQNRELERIRQDLKDLQVIVKEKRAAAEKKLAAKQQRENKTQPTRQQ